MVAEAHTLAAVKVDSTVIGGVSQLRSEMGSEVVNDPTDGNPWPTWVGLNAQNPKQNFKTFALAAALAAIAPPVVSIASLTAGFVTYQQKISEGGTRPTGSNHRSYTAKDGILIPRRITCDVQGDAEIEFQAIATYDGTNGIWVVADGVALPTLANHTVRFALGPITIAGVAITGVQSVDIDFGVKEGSLKGDGLPLPTFAYAEFWKPKVTVRTLKGTTLKSDAIPTTGKVATHANTSVAFRKRVHGGGFVSDATEEHVLITAAGMAHVDTPYDASNTAPSETTVIVDTYHDGTNQPLVIDTTAALA